MEDLTHDELRGELAALEAKATGLSQTRSHLQRQIDFGFETMSTREREREVSNERRELHQRIDSLKESLRTQEER